MSDSDSYTDESVSSEEDQLSYLPKTPFIMTISGCRGSGKTTMLINLLYSEYDEVFDKVYIFSSTFKHDPAFRVIKIPDDQIFDDYNDEYVKAIIDNATRDPRPEYEKPKILIIFDDCVGSASFKKSTTSQGTNSLGLLALRGRHYNISSIIISQFVSGIASENRKNMDCAICFQTTNEAELTAIYETYGFGKKKDWIKMFMKITRRPRDFYIYHNNASRPWTHKVYHNFTPVSIDFN